MKTPSPCCRWCGKSLEGRQTKWCSDTCRMAFWGAARDYGAALAARGFIPIEVLRKWRNAEVTQDEDIRLEPARKEGKYV